QRSVDHLDLHSFPTRRSSDLLFFISSLAQAVCLSELDGQIYGCERLASGDSWCKKKYGKESLAYRTTNTCSEELSYSLMGKTYKDRKSTRLNSSHVKISYAVF